MDEEFFEDLKEKIKPYFKVGESHEFGHTERVLNNAIEIAKTEEVDLIIVKVAALLHDIARVKEDNNEIECHAEEGSKIAEELLIEMNFPLAKIQEVVEAIRTHRLSKNLKAESKEAEIMQDADRLDSVGAILIARAFSSAHQYNRPFYAKVGDNVVGFIEERNEKVKPDNFNTQRARELAKARYNFAEEFVERFKKELEGKL